MPRILHVISGLQVGGAEMALLKLIVSARGGPFEHSVVALAPEGDMRQRFLAAGVELTVLDFRRAPLAGFWRLHALIRQSRPEIIQTWMYHADLLGGLAARLAGRREVIWGIRTTNLQRVGATGTAVVRKLCALLSRRVPHTIVCVAEAARKAHAAVGYDARRMVVVPNGFTLGDNGVQQKNREAVRAACGFGPDTVVIGTIGRFSEDKDPENFVRAAGALGKCLDNVRFMMVGRGVDDSNAELARWIAGTGCAERFVLLGERRDVGACLAAMDVFCLSSRTEGFPNVVGEAMALGVPCVVTDVGDAALLVGETGVVVPAEDPECLANALGRMVDLSPPERRDLGGKALDRIEQHFTIARTRARFEAIYKRIVEKGIP